MEIILQPFAFLHFFEIRRSPHYRTYVRQDSATDRCRYESCEVWNRPRLMSCRFRHVVIEPCNQPVCQIFDMRGIMEFVPFAGIHHQLGFYVK